MAKKNTNNTLKAQQAAQRAREEAARKKKIQAEINTKNSQISQFNGTLSELQSERTNLTNSIQKWQNGKDSFERESISGGEVKNIFEGEAAKSVKQKNDLKILSMNRKITSATAIRDAIGGQESRVKTKITTLSTEIAKLRNQL